MAKRKITQYDRDAMVRLSAEGTYYPEQFCEISKEFKFKSCADFKKKIATQKRRMAVEKRARARAIAKKYPEKEWTFETPKQKKARANRDKSQMSRKNYFDGDHCRDGQGKFVPVAQCRRRKPK